MAANVFNSERAISASVEVARAFVRLREMLASNAQLARKLDELEKKCDTQCDSGTDDTTSAKAETHRISRGIAKRLRPAVRKPPAL
jgi:hypothetical protein